MSAKKFEAALQAKAAVGHRVRHGTGAYQWPSAGFVYTPGEGTSLKHFVAANSPTVISL